MLYDINMLRTMRQLTNNLNPPGASLVLLSLAGPGGYFMELIMKTCTKCGEDKPLDQYNTRDDRLSGYRSECKKCQWKVQDLRKKKNYDPVKRRTYCAVRYALITGNITKPDSCEICNQKKKVIAHHQDHSYKLDVNWLCYRCHNKIHECIREIKLFITSGIKCPDPLSRGASS